MKSKTKFTRHTINHKPRIPYSLNTQLIRTHYFNTTANSSLYHLKSLHHTLRSTTSSLPTVTYSVKTRKACSQQPSLSSRTQPHQPTSESRTRENTIHPTECNTLNAHHIQIPCASHESTPKGGASHLRHQNDLLQSYLTHLHNPGAPKAEHPKQSLES